MRVAFLYNDASEDPAQLIDDDPTCSPVAAALERNGHVVTRISCTLDLAALRRELEQFQPEVAFNRVDSLGGSDAMMPAVTMLLDAMQIPYTGCSTAALTTTLSKLEVKQRLVGAGLPTPSWVISTANCCRSDKPAAPGFAGGSNVANSALRNEPMAEPGAVGPRISQSARTGKYILKSTFEHASFQIDDSSLVTATNLQDLAAVVRRREASSGRPHFAEEFIDGREFNLSLWGVEPEVLPAAEIDFSAYPENWPRIVGHRAKWDATSLEYDRTERHLRFTAADAPLLNELRFLAVECWRLFGLRGYARVDFRVDAAGRPWILEVNTNPCLAPDAGFAVALGHASISYDEGIAQILSFAGVGNELDRIDKENEHHQIGKCSQYRMPATR